MAYRVEKDSLGEVLIDADALYGAQTVRANENFNIVEDYIDPLFIDSLAYVKKACAIANYNVGALVSEKSEVIVKVCDEIIGGNHHGQFLTKGIQGGAGTSINMNINEVIANRSSQILGEPMGSYKFIHPNDHANLGQSTNDVIPTAGKITTSRMVKILCQELETLAGTFSKIADENSDVVKVGRTHLQDAVFITMGQVFHSFSSSVIRDRDRILNARKELDMINLGATAVGTEINAKAGYREEVVSVLSDITQLNLKSSNDLVDATKNVDSFTYIHSCLKILALNLSKICNDLRLMASGPLAGFNEIILPPVQPGSSIMPGKVNPVILEVVNQACFQIVGNDATISFAHEAGQMELNVFEPVIFYNLFKSLRILTNAIKTLNDKALLGLRINVEECKRQVDHSISMVTSLVDIIGYDKSSEVAKKALAEKKTLKEVILESNLMDEKNIDELLKPIKMVRRD